MIHRILPVVGVGFNYLLKRPESPKTNRFPFPSSHRFPSTFDPLSQKKVTKLDIDEEVPIEEETVEQAEGEVEEVSSLELSRLHRVAIDFLSPDPDLDLNASFYPQATAASLTTSAWRETFPQVKKVPKEIEGSTPIELEQEKSKKILASPTPSSSLVSSALSHIVDLGRAYLLSNVKEALSQNGISLTTETLEKFAPLFLARGEEKEKAEKELLALLRRNGKELTLDTLKKVEEKSLEFFKTKISKILNTNISSEQTERILRLINSKNNFKEIMQELVEVSVEIALTKSLTSIPPAVRPFLTKKSLLILKKTHEDKGFDQLIKSYDIKIKEKLALSTDIKPENLRKIIAALMGQNVESLKKVLLESGVEPPRNLESIKKELLDGIFKEIAQFVEEDLSPAEMQILSSVLAGSLNTDLLIKTLKKEGAEIVSSLCKEFKIPDVMVGAIEGFIKSDGSMIDVLSSSVWSATVGALEVHGKSFVQSAIQRIWVIGPIISGTGGDIVEGGIAVIKGDKDGLRKALLKEDFLKNVERQLGFPNDFLNQNRFLALYDLYQNHTQLFAEFSKSFEQSKEEAMKAFLKEQEKRLEFPEGVLKPDIFAQLDKSSLLAEAFGKKMIKDGVKTLIQGGFLILFPVAGPASLVATAALSYGVDYAADALESIVRRKTPEKTPLQAEFRSGERLQMERPVTRE